VRNERAVSEALGYVLVFGIILSMVAVVSVGGLGSLDNARQFERMENAERAFEVMGDNIEDLTQRGAPSRATEVKLADASIEAGDIASINVTMSRYNNDDLSEHVLVEYEPIVYTSLTKKRDGVSYALGATFRKSGGTAVMTGEPPMILSEDRIIIPIIQTRHGGDGSVTGSKTVLVRTALVQKAVFMKNTTKKSDVRINVSSTRAPTWRDYFKDNGAASCPPADQTDTFTSCTFEDVETVYVTYIVIDFEFE
jgi:hypothetical protein